MTDTRREMLELAAKACGELCDKEPLEHTLLRWNPLISDADCFALESQLELSISYYTDFVAAGEGDFFRIEDYSNHANDKRAARRLAATRAAAEIGRMVK